MDFKLLLGNFSFLFPSIFKPPASSLTYTVTESLCQVFHGTIRINCGQFYSVGWHCLTLFPTNCSACNAVWGLPAWHPAECMGSVNVQVKRCFITSREKSNAATWLVKIIYWLCITITTFTTFIILYLLPKSFPTVVYMVGLGKKFSLGLISCTYLKCQAHWEGR